MSASRLNEFTLRPSEQLLVWAFGISVAAHLLFYGTFQLGERWGWWKRDLMPSWLKSTRQKLVEIQKAAQKQAQLKQQQPEVPLMFVEVDPTVATQEAPKKATHYSSRNSKAANPDATIDSQLPKITGTQTHVPKTQDAARPKPRTLQPSTPSPAPTPGEAEKEEKAMPKGGPKPGDLAMAKPSEQPGEGLLEHKDTGEAKVPTHKRPRTLVEAMQQQPMAIPGQKMKQEGGVRRHLDSSAFDTIATPFGEYDAQLVNAISSHWWDLLDRAGFSEDRHGRVTVQFTLHSDGRVTDVTIMQSNVGDLLSSVCKLAIVDPAPYAPWPADMRRYFGKDSIDITFTFWYE